MQMACTHASHPDLSREPWVHSECVQVPPPELLDDELLDDELLDDELEVPPELELLDVEELLDDELELLLPPPPPAMAAPFGVPMPVGPS